MSNSVKRAKLDEHSLTKVLMTALSSYTPQYVHIVMIVKGQGSVKTLHTVLKQLLCLAS